MSVITKAGHGFSPDDPIYFGNLVPSDCGIVEGQTYYVLTVPTADTFTFSETIGGAEFALTFDITDGIVASLATYTPVSDGVMDPPDPVPTPTDPTLTSAEVSGIVRLRVNLNDTAEAKVRLWEVQITTKYFTPDPADPQPAPDDVEHWVWTTPHTYSLPQGSTELSIPALGSTVYAVRVRAEDVYGNQSAYSGEVTHTTVAGSDSLSAALAAISNAVDGRVIDGTNITENAITSFHVDARSISATALESILILSSLIYAGDPDSRHVEIDETGIRLVDAGGDLVVNIPTDPEQPVFFKGEVVAESFSSQTSNDLSGTVDVTGDAVVTLANGVSAPTVPPTVTPSVDSFALAVTPSGSPTGLNWAGGAFYFGLDPATGYVADIISAAGARLGRVPATGSTTTSTATLGSTSHVSDSAKATSDNAESQFATPLTMPRDGRITKVSVYLAGYTGDAEVRNCVWNSSGSLLGRTPKYTAASRAFANGNSDKYNKDITTISVSSGQTIRVGAMLVSDTDAWQWDRDDGAGKTTYIGSGEDFDPLQGIVTDSSHKPNVYITYEYDVDTRLETAPMIAACSDGTYIYTLDTNGVVWKYEDDSDVYAHVAHSSVQTAITGTKSKAGMFYDATAGELIITTTTGTGAGVYPKLVRVNTSTLAVSSTVYTATTGPTFSGTTDTFRGGARLNDPLNGSTPTYWLATTGAAYAYTFSGVDLTYVADRDFGTAASMGDGLTHDGTNFRGYDSATPAKVWTFSNWDWTTDPATYYFAYAWYDSAGTTHETAISPRTLATLRRRERVTLSQPGIPTGGADDPDNVRIYFKPAASDPGAGGLKLQLTDNLTSRVFTTYASGGAADGGGTAFPAGSPASIKSSATGWTLKGNGVINREGTAFPGSPATGDHYYRSDLGMEFRYDGTRWLSSQLFSMSPDLFTAGAASVTGIISATTVAYRRTWSPALQGGTDIWLEDWHCSFFINGGTALGASHKWVITLASIRDTNGTADTVATINIDSGSSTVVRRLSATINARLNNGTVHDWLQTTATKTGTPGTYQGFDQITYRIVAT